jgi:hypothetical protein
MNKHKNLVNLFKKEDLIYPNQAKINSLDVEVSLKDVIINICLPKIFARLNFTMDFDDIFSDPVVRSFCNKSKRIHTIGFISKTQLLNRQIIFSEIGLEDNISLFEINRKIQDFSSNQAIKVSEVELEILEAEYKFSERVCIDFENNGQIIVIESEGSFCKVLNSNIKKLVESIIDIKENYNTYENIYGEVYNPDAIEATYNNIIDGLRKIDPLALEDENCLWNQIFKAAILDIERD